MAKKHSDITVPVPVIFTAEKNYILDSIALYAALFISVALCLIINSFPAVFNKPAAVTDLNIWGFLNQEPMERLFYIVVVLLFPSLFLFFRSYAEKKAGLSVSGKLVIISRLFSFFAAILLIVLIKIDFAVKFRDSDYNYILNTVIHKNTAAALVLAAVLCLLIYVLNMDAVKNVIYRFKLNLLYVIFDIIVILFVIISAFHNFPLIRDTYHFEAVFYSVAQVFNGKTVLVDFTSQYGLYGHFLEPLFRLAGGLTVWKFSLFMSLLIMVSWLCIYFFMKKVIKNRGILFVFFIAAIFYSYVNFYLDYRGREYFQYNPLRMIFPSLFFLLAYAYFGTKSLKLYYFIPVMLALGILWNPDIGMVCMVSWFAVLSYIEVLKITSEKKTIKESAKKIAFHALNLAEITIIVMVIFALYAYFRSGAFPDFSELTRYQKMYYLIGFGMEPMTLVHPWNLVALAFIAGIVRSVSALVVVDEEKKKRNTVVFLLTIFGIGIFTYFQGRSHDWALVPVLYIPIILSAIFAEDLLNEISKARSLRQMDAGRILLFAALIFLMAAPLAGVVKKKYPSFREFMGKFDRSYMAGSVGYLKPFFKPGEEAYVISDRIQSVIYAETGTVNPLNIPGQVEITLQSDMDKLKKYLISQGDGRKVIWDRNDGGEYVNHYGLNFYSVYKPEVIFPDSQIEIYKQYSAIPDTGFLFDNGNYLFHCKEYNKLVYSYIDKDGNFTENFYFDSKKVVNFRGEFTIEMLIKPAIVEHGGTKIIGNMSDKNGFALKRDPVENSAYVLVWMAGSKENVSPKFILKPDVTHYLVITYSNNNAVIFDNGEKTLTFKANITKSPESFKMSEKWNGFKGQVKELKISSYAINRGSVEENYKKYMDKIKE